MIEIRTLHESLVASADDFREFASLNIKWHDAIARASGSESLSTLLYSISHGLQAARKVEEYDTPETHRQVIQDHAIITEAIAARGADLAELGMRLHIAATHARPLALATREVLLTSKGETVRTKIKSRSKALTR